MRSDDEVPSEAIEAVDTWLKGNEPLSRAEFDRIQSALIRSVGVDATHPQYGTNKHFRKTNATEAGLFAHEQDIPLVDFDNDVEFVDLHGVAVDGGFVPLLLCIDGPIEEAADRMHRLYHLIDDTAACDHCTITDGGEIPPARQCTHAACEREAVDPMHPGALCSVHLEGKGDVEGDAQTADEDPVDDVEGIPREPQTEYYRGLDYTKADSGGVGESTKWDSWMPTNDGMGGKLPFAKYHDHPALEYYEPDNENARTTKNPRHVWSDPSNWTDFDTVDEQVRMDSELCERAFIMQRESDPATVSNDPPADSCIFADGDNVVDPATGAPIPEYVAAIETLAGGEPTWQEFSTSDDGNHAMFHGRFPDGVRTRYIKLRDEPVEGFDEPPMLELYEGPKVAVLTGKQVAGTPDAYADVDPEGLQRLIDAGTAAHPNVLDAAKLRRTDDVDGEGDQDAGATDVGDAPAVFDPEAGPDDAPDDLPKCYRRTLAARYETANHVTNLYAANLGIHAGYSPEECVEHFGQFPPARDPAAFDGQHTLEELERTESKVDNGDLEAISVSKLRETGFFGDGEGCDDDCPIHGGVSTNTEHDVSADDAYKASDDGRAVSALPITQLDALKPAERRRFAKKRGLEWPSTDDARDELFASIAETMRQEDDRIVDAPTSLGKSHTIASTRWGARQDITGDRPVVHLLETQDARDEAVDVAEEHGGQYHVLLGRHEACPVAAGDHDDELTINGEAASEWLDAQCEGKGMPFSAAHRHLEDHNDQGVELPCGGGRCSAITQWKTYREGPDGELDYWPLVIATHNFAFAPGLRMHNNVVVDEEPSYAQDDLSTDRIRSAVGAYLREIDAPVKTWEAFVQLSRHDDYQGDAANERDALEDVLWTDPGQEWYFEEPDAHTLAPALARAIFRAEDRANGRRFGKTMHEPPRLEAGVRDDDEWNREWVSVVLDESNDVQTVRTVPDFGAARSIVGLDAHPATPLWQANTVPWIKTTNVLEPEQRQLWRRYERGLRVVQVGDATRPLSGSKALEWLNEDKLEVLLEHLVDEYGDQFRTAITTAQTEDRLTELMEEAGVDVEYNENGDAKNLMHFGAEKSRNDFANESIGLVNGCMDPGDDYVLDLLAELDLEAEVETAVTNDGEEKRAKGRGFEGDDAETASEILASVRENHIAQSAGRYARSPDDPDVTATVFVRTDATPAGFADVQTPGVEWVFTDLQEKIVDELRSSASSKKAREIADTVGCTKEHVRQTLERLSDNEFGEPTVHVSEGAGSHGATLYSESGLPSVGFVDIHESPTDPYGDSSRWALAIRDPTTADDVDQGVSGPDSGDTRPTIWPQPASDTGG